MKRIFFYLSASAIALLTVISCTKELDSEISGDDDIVSEAQVIPLDDALKTLDNFVAELEGSNALTKAGSSKTIVGIETHYGETLTKSGEALPDAYIVNYGEEDGFAVLGANSSVLPIIAYTEEGSFSMKDLDEYNASLENAEPSEVDEEDPLLFLPQKSQGVVTTVISMGISRDTDEINMSGNKAKQVTYDNPPVQDCVAPLLQTKWGQGSYGVPGVYNKYCIYRGNVCYAGCCMIATAQVMAYNKRKDHDYSQMITTGKLTAAGLDPVKVDNTGRFIGTIFDDLVLSASDYGSGSRVAKIRTYLRQMDGYYNVYKSHQTYFTDDNCIATAKGMLKFNKKPVIVSGTTNAGNSHCWVLDGYKYFNGVLYFHCNWGWEGRFDGYFSADALCPTDRDGRFDDINDDDYALYLRLQHRALPQYTWSFDMLTYDLY